jgi:hypothetical protein
MADWQSNRLLAWIAVVRACSLARSLACLLARLRACVLACLQTLRHGTIEVLTAEPGAYLLTTCRYQGVVQLFKVFFTVQPGLPAGKRASAFSINLSTSTLITGAGSIPKAAVSARHVPALSRQHLCTDSVCVLVQPCWMASCHCAASLVMLPPSVLA